jgi:serine/threonine-protein kinase
MDEQALKHAERHIKNAWIVGIISAAATFIFSAIGAYSQTVQFRYGFDTWSLIDVALIAGLTFGIYKKNRFCALSLLIYFVLGKVAAAAYGGKFGHGIGALLFGYFFFRGTIATFQIQKHLVETGQKSKKKRGAIFYIGVGILGPIIIAVGFLIIFGALSPPTEVIPGKMLNKKYSTFIREQGLIRDGDEIIYWYSDGFPGFKNGFYFYTKEKVIVYCKDWEDPVIAMPFTIIEDIKFEHHPSLIEDSRIILRLNDKTEIDFPVSSEKGGDKKFYDTLTKMWETKRLKTSDKDQ